MKIAASEISHSLSRPGAHSGAEPAILFIVSRQLFAISADAVQEIRTTDSISGATAEIELPSIAKVRHCFERNQRNYYVVNACAHFGLRISRPTLVLILRQMRAAVLVDRIERMAELRGMQDLPKAFAGDERRWYRGLAYANDVVIPVVDPRGFLSPAEFHALDQAFAAQPGGPALEGAAS